MNEWKKLSETIVWKHAFRLLEKGKLNTMPRKQSQNRKNKLRKVKWIHQELKALLHIIRMNNNCPPKHTCYTIIIVLLRFIFIVDVKILFSLCLSLSLVFFIDDEYSDFVEWKKTRQAKWRLTKITIRTLALTHSLSNTKHYQFAHVRWYVDKCVEVNAPASTDTKMMSMLMCARNFRLRSNTR